MGVHQGSALSPLLFIIVMEEATKLAREDGPWELLYADDLVLTAEPEEEVTDMEGKDEAEGTENKYDKNKINGD